MIRVRKRPKSMAAAIVTFVAVASHLGCSNDHVRSGSDIPNPTRVIGPATDVNGPANPVPLGQVARVEGWDVKVIELTRLTQDGLMQVPPSGYAFVLLRVEATRIATQPQPPAFLAPGLLGASRVERGMASDPVCWGGKSVNHPVEQGTRVRQDSCISVTLSDVPTLVVSLGLLNETWFAVR
jgi:hypothetical protein